MAVNRGRDSRACTRARAILTTHYYSTKDFETFPASSTTRTRLQYLQCMAVADTSRGIVDNAHVVVFPWILTHLFLLHTVVPRDYDRS